MMISEQQARYCAQYLREAHDSVNLLHPHPVSPEVLERAIEAARNAPEMRVERIKAAREWIDSGGVDPDELATRLLLRIMCDRIR